MNIMNNFVFQLAALALFSAVSLYADSDFKYIAGVPLTNGTGRAVAGRRLIHLRARTIDRLAQGLSGSAGMAARVEPAAVLADQAARSNFVAVIVQCARHPDAAEIAALAEAGEWLDAYLPENAWLVMMRSGCLERLTALPLVEWVGLYRAEYKMPPSLRQAPADAAAPEYEISLVVFLPGRTDATAGFIRQSGGCVLDAARGARRGTIRAKVSGALLARLAELPEVEWIEPTARPVWFNNVAGSAGLMNAASVRANHGLTGVGQIVCVCDTGLDTGQIMNLHPDFTNRVRAGFSWGRTNDWGDYMGHGTHCAGSVLGSGAAFSNGLFCGVAAGAELVMQSIADAANGVYLPPDMSDLFRQSYAAGARLQSDSWGDRVAGAYTILSRQADEFVWMHPDMLLVFSAGNEGTDADMDGVVDLYSLGAPASAKNVLAVGAACSFRPAGSGGYSGHAWGDVMITRFPAWPLRSGPVSAPWDGVHQGMASFSSRGPCLDGRIKPDVVAPGTDIVSCRSRMPGASALWGTGEGVLANAASNYYTFSGGTSMSTPLTAGALALIRQYYVERRGWARPSAALLKATLAAGARSLAPGQYGMDPYREIPAGARPNNVEGWGHVNLEATLFPGTGLTNMFDDSRALADGQQNVYALQAHASNRLSIVLAWSDYPSSEAASINLVNDLDLLVVAPDGKPYYANGRKDFDRVNNIEGVDISPARAGVYTIYVMGYNVPHGPQPYAIVAHEAPAPAPVLAGLWHAPRLITNNVAPVIHAELVGGPSVPVSVQCRYRINSGAWRQRVMTPQQDGSPRCVYAAQIPPPPIGGFVEYTVTAADGHGVVLSCPTNSFHVQGAALYVSPRARPAPPYDKLANAFKNLQSAVDYAADGSLILVDQGRYEGTLRLDKRLVIQSLHGPENTFLDGLGRGPCVSNTAPAILDGFALTGGRATEGGGAYLSVGALRNCRISGNAAVRGGGVLNSMGSLDGCLIEGNTAAQGGGVFQFYGGLLNNCVISGNSAHEMAGGLLLYGMAGPGGEARNCLIVRNTAAQCGGVTLALGGRLINATVADNSSSFGAGVMCALYGEMVNSVMRGNTPANYDGDGMSARPIIMAHCCVAAEVTNANIKITGALTADPDFRNTAQGDYRLMVNSPCRDAGTNEPWMTNALDLAGCSRIVHNRVDIGVYELCLPRDEFNMAARRHGAGDYDGDGRMDPAIYSARGALWRAGFSSLEYQIMETLFGGTDYRPVPGDYDGDRMTEMAVYHVAGGFWMLPSPSFGGLALGGAEYRPVPGDYDGDGRTDPAVFHPSSGGWLACLSGTGYTPVALVFPETSLSMTPAPGDYDGDGKTDPCLFRADDGLWLLALSGENYRVLAGNFGWAGCVPVSADYDGDGLADPAVHDARTALWGVLFSRRGYAAVMAHLPGASGKPAPGDYDGDGLEDPAVYDQATGIWTAWLSKAHYEPARLLLKAQGAVAACD